MNILGEGYAMGRMISRRGFSLGVASGLMASAPFGAGFAQSARLKTTIANAAGNLNLAVQELLRQQGFMEEFGLEPTYLNVADGAKILGGLLGGDLDSSMMSGFGQVFPAIEKGAKLKIIAATSLSPSLALFTSKPDIKSLKDLEGRVVGTGSLGALLHQLVVALLQKNGVDISKVRFVNIGASGDVFRATTMGTVDAGTGEAAILEDMSPYTVRLIPGGNMTTELSEYTYQAAWTTDRIIETRRDILVRSLAAQARLYRFLHTPESREPFLKARAKVLPNSPPSEAIAQWNYIQHYKPYATGLMMSEERFRYMQQLNVDLGVQSAVMPMARVADMSLAQEALRLLDKAEKK
jgi:ABC-type nitrate/sulfonate/bicarbonate transport system substrate-binding protein